MHSSQARRRSAAACPSRVHAARLAGMARAFVRTILSRRRPMCGAHDALRRGCVNPDLSFVDNDSGRLLR
ncbi:hypothetical protein CBM2585_B120008 [Cupriavidus taiwanensis]|nr:hypothetical protein CBM2585_B120008 [Cupriavidus taiwanensis]